jgi:hypothetical protein
MMLTPVMSWLLHTPLPMHGFEGKTQFLFQSSSSVTAYLQSICLTADDLAVIGPPIDDLDLVIYTLNGLGPNFRVYNFNYKS